MQWLKEHRGLQLESYDALWQWSVTDLESFWRSIWDYFGFTSPTPYTAVLDRHVMPGAKWFDGATLNYAAAVFRGGRALAGKAGAPGIMALNALRAIAAQVTTRAA